MFSTGSISPAPPPRIEPSSRIPGWSPSAGDACGHTATKNAIIAGFVTRQSPSGSTWCDWMSKTNSPGRFISVLFSVASSHSRSHALVVAVL